MAKRPIIKARSSQSQAQSLFKRGKIASFETFSKGKIASTTALKKGQSVSIFTLSKAKNLGKRGLKRIDKKPMTSFFTVLIVLLLLIIVGSFLRRPKIEKETVPAPKEVAIYSIGHAPRVTIQGKMEKSGIIKVVALTPGVVSSVNVSEGQEVTQGTTLVSIGSNYSGGNTASIGREIAAATYQNVKDTYNTQKDVIASQRDLANKQKDNADALRDITSKSLDDTRGLIDLNNNILDTLKSNLATEQSGANDPAKVLTLKQSISQYQSAIAGLNSQLRANDYSSNGDKPAAALVNISRDIAQKQLDIQEKALKLSQETSALSLRMAQVQEAAYFPSAPFDGVVERVYVNPGDSVNPGTPLLVLHGAQTLKLVARVPQNIARNASLIEESVIHIGEMTIKLTPSYISNEATDGDLYTIDYTIPSEFQNKITNNEYLTIDLPVGTAQTSGVIPFIPIDSVYQTESNAYIFIDKKGVATAQTITLGQVMGSYVEVRNGLSTGDTVILTRNVIAGDKIKTIN